MDHTNQRQTRTSKPRYEWSNNAGNSLKRSYNDFERPRYKRDYEYADDLNNSDHEPCFEQT